MSLNLPLALNSRQAMVVWARWGTKWLLAVSAVLATGALAQQSASAFATEAYYRVAIGSFSSEQNAQRALAQTQAKLIEYFQVESASTTKGLFYRVISGPISSRALAEDQVATAQEAGFADAWLVAERPLDNFGAISSGPLLPAAPPVLTKKPEAMTFGVSTKPPNRPATLPQVASDLESATVTPSFARLYPSAGAAQPLPKSGDQVALDGQAVLPVSLGSVDNASKVAISPAEPIRIRRFEGAERPVKVDGKLNEAIWAQVSAYDEFVVLEPDTLERGPHATLIRFVYTDLGLYVGAELEQPADTLIRRLSGRDVRQLNRDSINITLDTSGEGRYGFWFGINLGDSLMDGTALPERRFSNEWDGPWRGASSVTSNGWSAEFFIPWGAVAMPSTGDVRQMGLYMSRKVAYLDQRWGWPTLPSTRPKFMSALQPLEMTGVSPRQQYNIYPFTAVTVDEIDDETRYRVGADIFWRPSSSFQANATIYPDFGSVESDDVVINLSATEQFFPEKRLFFVEGQEIFVAGPRADTRSSSVGVSGPPTTLVNTRRIGGRPQEPDLTGSQSVTDRELIRPVELLGAAKLTGQIGRFRYGVLGAFEDEAKFNALDAGLDRNLYQDGTNYGIARLLYEDNARGAYRAIGVLSTAVLHHDRDAFASGIDMHYLTPNGKLKSDLQLFRSDLDGEQAGYGGYWDFEYTFRQGVQQRLGIEYFDRHVDINDLGFQARNNYMQIRTAHTRTNSNLRWARNNQLDIRGALQKNGDGLFTRGGIFLSNKTTFDNLTSITARASHFAPRYDDLNSFGNGAFRLPAKSAASVQYQSNTIKAISYSVGAAIEEEDLGGDTLKYEFKINWRPADGFALTAGAKFSDRKGWLLHQEDANFTTFNAKQWQPNVSIEYFLSARQQFRISFQWVGIRAAESQFYLIPAAPGKLVSSAKPIGPSDSFSISDMVFQARYRWEMAPLSDLFIVYSRASDLARALGEQKFDNLLNNAWNEPIANQLVVKVRYRFGS